MILQLLVGEECKNDLEIPTGKKGSHPWKVSLRTLFLIAAIPKKKMVWRFLKQYISSLLHVSFSFLLLLQSYVIIMNGLKTSIQQQNEMSVLWAIKVHWDVHGETAVWKKMWPPLCALHLSCEISSTTTPYNHYCGIIFAATFYDAPSTTISEQKSSITSEWDITFSVEK